MNRYTRRHATPINAGQIRLILSLTAQLHSIDRNPATRSTPEEHAAHLRNLTSHEAGEAIDMLRLRIAEAQQAADGDAS